MRGIRLALFIVASASLITVSVTAKGVTTRLIISGPGFEYPTELASREAVSADVFGGNFLGAEVDAPNRNLPRYTISFLVETPRNPVQLMYVIEYVRNPLGGGFVYLPGERDEWYRLNVRTIMRGAEGRWLRAAAPWSDAINATLPTTPRR